MFDMSVYLFDDMELGLIMSYIINHYLNNNH